MNLKDLVKDIIINDETVKSLKLWLNKFPDDAKIVFEDMETYTEYRIQIACNFEHQIRNNKVVLIRGDNLYELKRN